MATVCQLTNEDVFMAVPIGALVLWCALLAAVMLGLHPAFDLTTGAIFFGFGVMVYVVGGVVGAFSAIRAISRARGTWRSIPVVTRLLVVGTVAFLAFPWVAFPILQALRGIGEF
jgi:hypothetical protein